MVRKLLSSSSNKIPKNYKILVLLILNMVYFFVRVSAWWIAGMIISEAIPNIQIIYNSHHNIWQSDSQVNYLKRRIIPIPHIDTAKHVLNESKMQNWYIVQHIKSVFSKLAVLLRVWQRRFFTKLERRVKQRNSLFKKKNSKFISQVISFLNLKHVIESGGVLVMLNLIFYVFKGKQLK